MPQKFQSPFPVQLAIQGGGAKLCALVAAMDAIQSLQRQGLIAVRRIAGTSAGAIVGALFAANIDMGVVREHLRGISADNLARYFPPPGLNVLTRLGRGRPLWKPDFIISELQRFLEKDARVFTFRDIEEKNGTQLLVVAANLTESRKVVHREADGKVVDALLDSCGLPFCFRTWSKSGGAVIVDGGVCENLPSDELTQYPSSDGLIIGITFDPTRGRAPTSLANFSMALLDTAMNNSMSKAKLRLGSDSICSIPTDIGTFDFEFAIKHGLADPHYGQVRNFVDKFFRGHISSGVKKTQIVSRQGSVEPTKLMSTLGEVYQKQHESSRLQYNFCSLVLQANSLADNETEDFITYRMEFHTLEEPIYCHAVFLSEIEDPIIFGRSELTVLDPDGMPVEMLKIPIHYEDEPHDRLLLFFLPPLEPHTGPYTMEVKDIIQDAVRPLRETGRDRLVFAPLRAAGDIKQIDLVLLWPAASGKADMVPHNGLGKGHDMSRADLMRYNTQVGFNAVGRIGLDVSPETEFGVELRFLQS
jgi:predicted acylesterase/phospholipase RssA